MSILDQIKPTTLQSFTLNIGVTKEDFENGERAQCDKCAIALAAIRSLKNDSAYKDFTLGGVYYSHITIWGSGNDSYESKELPEKIVKAIYKFDRGIKCEPFDAILLFELVESE